MTPDIRQSAEVQSCWIYRAHEVAELRISAKQKKKKLQIISDGLIAAGHCFPSIPGLFPDRFPSKTLSDGRRKQGHPIRHRYCSQAWQPILKQTF